jgi:hypothetical protein
MRTTPLIEGSAVTPAMGWTRRCRRCPERFSDPQRLQVDLAARAHTDATGHGCYGASYGRIRDDRVISAAVVVMEGQR